MTIDKIDKKDLPYSTGNSNQYCVMPIWGKNKVWIYVNV